VLGSLAASVREYEGIDLDVVGLLGIQRGTPAGAGV
jgi:hypothetical protein